MKKSELTEIIRELVREEIREQLPHVLAEVFSGLMAGRQMVNEQQYHPYPPQQPQYQYPPQMMQPPQYPPHMMPQPQAGPPANPAAPFKTGNPAVDAILAGTQVNPAHFGGGQMVSMDGGFDKVGVRAAQNIEQEMRPPAPPPQAPRGPAFAKGSIMGMIQDTISTPIVNDNSPAGNMAAMQNAPSVLDFKGSLPSTVAKALNKDFRSMLKAIDQKKKGGVISNPMLVGTMPT